MNIARQRSPIQLTPRRTREAIVARFYRLENSQVQLKSGARKRARELRLRRFDPLPLALGHPEAEKPLVSHLEGPGCVQGGLVDLPQPFDVRKASHSLLPRQNFAAASYAPAVKKPLRKLAGEEKVYAKDGTKSIKKVADPDKVKSAYKEDGCNDLVVIAKGPTVIQKINGVVFSQLTDHDEKYSTSKGWIAFQDHGKGTNVEFKDIRIRIDK